MKIKFTDQTSGRSLKSCLLMQRISGCMHLRRWWTMQLNMQKQKIYDAEWYRMLCIRKYQLQMMELEFLKTFRPIWKGNAVIRQMWKMRFWNCTRASLQLRERDILEKEFSLFQKWFENLQSGHRHMYLFQADIVKKSWFSHIW